MSLKVALEQLLGGPCYHMMEVFGHPEHVPIWRAAAEGAAVGWDELFSDYVAAVDWPVAGFWEPVAAANPDAVILHSTRDSAATWWRSASDTIFHDLDKPGPPDFAPWREMWSALASATFTPDFLDQDAAMAAYDRHNAHVRATADPARLVEWQPGDGWAPICEALGVPVPEGDFPHTNTTEEWVARRGG